MPVRTAYSEQVEEIPEKELDQVMRRRSRRDLYWSESHPPAARHETQEVEALDHPFGFP